ncbi:hypothetical protein ID858_18220, partial [Xenorhabdus sp. DI]|uniref:hypothetical protein n=1 Tax=Xenorhabdus doucetiae TaxID=351671 RepID=UPI0019AA3AB8
VLRGKESGADALRHGQLFHHIRAEEAVKLAQGHDMAINTKHVPIVNKNEGIFGEKTIYGVS